MATSSNAEPSRRLNSEPEPASCDETRVVKLMSPADVRELFSGTFEVTDSQLYTFRPGELQWLSEQIRCAVEPGAQTHRRVKLGETSDLLRRNYAIQIDADWLDDHALVVHDSVEPPVRRIVVRTPDIVPNFSMFRISKPISLTLLDIVGVVWIISISLWAMNAYAAAAMTLSFVAFRECANMFVRSLWRRERNKGLEPWREYRTYLGKSV